jgi:hypothetical protein
MQLLNFLFSSWTSTDRRRDAKTVGFDGLKVWSSLLALKTFRPLPDSTSNPRPD